MNVGFVQKTLENKGFAEMAKNPQSVADKWANNLAGANKSIIDGVNAVTVSPMQKAVERADEYVNGVSQNVDKWKRNTGAVTIDKWKQFMLLKGVPRIGAGAAQAKDKMAKYMGQLIPYQETLKAQLPPKTKANAQQRMIQWMQGMQNFKPQK